MASAGPDHRWLREDPSRFGLSLEGDRLKCDGVRLSDIAAKYDTPTYVYSLTQIKARYHELASALSGADATICYALKANSNLAVVSTLAKEGAGADVVSGGELLRALRAGVSPRKIVYSGVGKRDEELVAAIKTKLLSINVESVQEIERLAKLSAKLGIKTKVSLRVNPDVDPQTHPYLATGLLGSKFGIDMDDAPKAAASVVAASHLELVGLACHIGSMVQDAEPYRLCAQRMAGLFKDLREQGVALSHLDLGGGLGIPYQEGDPELSPEPWGEALVQTAKEFGVRLVVEPGRYLVGNCGVLLTRVVGTKRSGERDYLVVDAAMNDLIRPALYDAYHAIVQDPLPAPQDGTQPYEIVGPVCECGDFIAKGRELVPPVPGDLMAILSAGAYCMTMSSNYNTRTAPAEIVVQEGKLACVRPRQKLESLLSLERDIEWD